MAKITAKITCLIGHNRVGKTSIERDMIKSYRKTKPSHHKVFAFDPQRKLQDLIDRKIDNGRNIYNIVDNDWEYFFERRDFLLVIDDYRFLLDDDKLDKNFYKLMSLRDENGIDIILSMHHPEMIHKKVAFYVTDFFLFYTVMSDDTSDCRRKLMNADVILFIMDSINKYVAIHGRWGPKEGDYRYCIYRGQDMCIQAVSHLGETGQMLIDKVND